MADSYIDYFEIGEYGSHFIDQAVELEGASPMVDIAALRSRVRQTVTAVNAELEKAGVSRSGKRGERGTTSELSAALRDVIERFYFHLRSQPGDADFDFEAFFPRRQLGGLSQLKAADMLARGQAVSHGFSTNPGLADAASWQRDIAAACQALSDATSSRGNANIGALKATATLQQARQDFLRLYNRVAKRLVRGLLIELDREVEYRHFFLDLQVHEGGRPAGDADAGDDSGDDVGDDVSAQPGEL